MNEQYLIRLIPLAEEVINHKYPAMSTRRPEHFRGIAMILAREILSYNVDEMSNEHIIELMEVDLSELKKSLSE